jgi:hypothetical protein
LDYNYNQTNVSDRLSLFVAFIDLTWHFLLFRILPSQLIDMLGAFITAKPGNCGFGGKFFAATFADSCNTDM